MKEIKRNVTESKTLYEISEDELIEIKRKERAKGRQDVVEYIDFAFCNYIYKMNIGGVFSFIKSLIKFCRLKEYYCDITRLLDNCSRLKNIQSISKITSMIPEIYGIRKHW